MGRPFTLTPPRQMTLEALAAIGETVNDVSDIQAGRLTGSQKIAVLHQLRKTQLVTFVETTSGRGTNKEHRQSIKRIEITDRGRRALIGAAPGIKLPGSPLVRATGSLPPIEANLFIEESKPIPANIFTDATPEPTLPEVLPSPPGVPEWPLLTALRERQTKVAAAAELLFDIPGMRETALQVIEDFEAVKLDPWQEEYLAYAAKYTKE